MSPWRSGCDKVSRHETREKTDDVVRNYLYGKNHASKIISEYVVVVVISKKNNMLVKLDPQPISQTHVSFQGCFLASSLSSNLGKAYSPTCGKILWYILLKCMACIHVSNRFDLHLDRLLPQKTNMSPEKSMVGVGIKQAFLFRNGPFFKWTFLSFLGCKYFGETIIPSTQPQTWLRPSWRASGTNSQRYYRKLMETHWCFNF